MQTDNGLIFSIPTIDVPATSQNLKKLRENNNITVAQIQKLLGMENPQSIYIWENPEKKYLPRIDNLITLAKLYKVTLDEIIIIKEGEAEATDLFLKEQTPAYGFSEETLNYIRSNSSTITKSALKNYYGFTI